MVDQRQGPDRFGVEFKCGTAGHGLDALGFLTYPTLGKSKDKTILMAKRKSIEERLRDYEHQYRELAVTLAAAGYVWKGTVVRQMLTCGKKRCACHQDERRRHGPYAYWSTKVKGRTVSRLLNPAEANLYEEWIRNRRMLEKIQRRMLALSKKVALLMLRRQKSDEQTSGDR